MTEPGKKERSDESGATRAKWSGGSQGGKLCDEVAFETSRRMPAGEHAHVRLHSKHPTGNRWGGLTGRGVTSYG